jgi:hypothetical protein
MYWSNQEVDNTIYPPCCPGCHALKWLDNNLPSSGVSEALRRGGG